MPVITVMGMPCDFCGEEFDPISTRWLCPQCKTKRNCCSGAPLPFRTDADTPREQAAASG